MLNQGRILKAGRILAGMSQGQLAEAAGVHKNCVQYWEARTLLAAQSGGLDRVIQALEERGIAFISTYGDDGGLFTGAEYAETTANTSPEPQPY